MPSKNAATFDRPLVGQNVPYSLRPTAYPVVRSNPTPREVLGAMSPTDYITGAGFLILGPIGGMILARRDHRHRKQFIINCWTSFSSFMALTWMTSRSYFRLIGETANSVEVTKMGKESDFVYIPEHPDWKDFDLKDFDPRDFAMVPPKSTREYNSNSASIEEFMRIMAQKDLDESGQERLDEIYQEFKADEEEGLI